MLRDFNVYLDDILEAIARIRISKDYPKLRS